MELFHPKGEKAAFCKTEKKLLQGEKFLSFSALQKNLFYYSRMEGYRREGVPAGCPPITEEEYKNAKDAAGVMAVYSSAIIAVSAGLVVGGLRLLFPQIDFGSELAYVWIVMVVLLVWMSYGIHKTFKMMKKCIRD